MCSLFLFLIFPRSFLLVRYNVSSVVQVFRTRWCIILQIALENVSSLQVKWIRCKCFLRDANKQKSNDVSAGVYRGCGATSNPTSLSPLKRQHYCGVGFIMLKKHRLSFSRRSRPIRYFIPLGLPLSLGVDFRQFSWINSSIFCLFKMWVAVTELPDCGCSSRSKFPPLSLVFITQWHTALMSTASSPQKANNRRWISVGVSMSRVKYSARCLILFDKDEIESSILNLIELKPLSLPSRTPL